MSAWRNVAVLVAAVAFGAWLSAPAAGDYTNRLWKSPDLNDDDYSEPTGLAVYDYDGDGTLDLWAGDDNSTVRVYAGDDYRELTRFSLSESGFDVATIVVADFDGDEQIEVAMGLEGGWYDGGVGVIDTVTREQRFLDTSLGPVWALAAADVNQNGRSELVIATAGLEERVMVLNGRTFSTIWESLEQNGDLTSLVAEDTNGDGRIEVWVGVDAYNDDFESYGEVQVFRGQDGVQLWNRTDLPQGVLSMHYTGSEVLVGTGGLGEGLEWDGYIVRLDAKDYVELRRSGDLDEMVQGLWQADIEGTGTPRLIIGTSSGIEILDQNFNKVGSIDQVGDSGKHDGLWVGDIEGDGSLELAFHANQMSLDWTDNSYVYLYGEEKSGGMLSGISDSVSGRQVDLLTPPLYVIALGLLLIAALVAGIGYEFVRD